LFGCARPSAVTQLPIHFAKMGHLSSCISQAAPV
jgi:hypothetical protein